jgi:hypothetical protein
VGWVVADQGDAPPNPGDATFDNFFAADHDPGALCDTFDSADDTKPPFTWLHYDPLGDLGDPFQSAGYVVTNGAYRIYAPIPPIPDLGAARAGSFVTNSTFFDFYVSADLIDFDDTVRQAFGVAARVNDPGLGTTTGYLFSWEPGDGTLPGTTNGDLDISPLAAEQPIGQIEVGDSRLHLERGKSYRFVFMGKGFDFEGQVYELPDVEHPLIRLPAHDASQLYANGFSGLVVADQGGGELNPGDATFDNFVATSIEPRLAVSQSGNTITISWPAFTSYALESSPSLTVPVWTKVTTGITQNLGTSTHSVAGAIGTKFYRLSCSCN